jgi:hypothetical protein
MGADTHQRGPVIAQYGPSQRPRDGVEVVAVLDVEHTPSVAREALADVLRERELRRTLDGDVVVVVEHRQAAEAQVSGD